MHLTTELQNPWNKKLTEPKWEIDNSTIMDSNFNIPLSIMGITARKNINKEIQDMNKPINQLGPMDIYSILGPTTA